MGLATGSTRMLPPPVKHVFYRSSLSMWFWFTAVNPFRTAVPFWGQTTQISSSFDPKQDCGSKRVKARVKKKHEKHTHREHRQSACCYAALHRDRDFAGAACTSVEASPSSINSSQASCCCACSSARLEPCGQGCVHHAPEINMMLLYVLRTFFSFDLSTLLLFSL